MLHGMATGHRIGGPEGIELGTVERPARVLGAGAIDAALGLGLVGAQVGLAGAAVQVSILVIQIDAAADLLFDHSPRQLGERLGNADGQRQLQQLGVERACG
jgi:hypothetical protein